jgi:putative NIF3 family GTP cyclohydrolase 1 type 2
MTGMLTGPLSRREFVAAAAASLTAARPGAAQTLTAGALIERIRANIGAPWNDKSADGLKAGDPTTLVTGVAVTVMATLDVLRRASAAKQNFVVTQEPTYYAANDNPGTREIDPVYLAKRAFIEKERLVICRLVDHWHQTHPQSAPRALANALGWGQERWTADEDIYSVPATTLSTLAAEVRKRLNTRGGVRIVGRPDLPIRTVYVAPGTTSMPGVLEHIARADVVIAGEPREWEAVPYIADAVTAGQAKGMISLGRLVSEEPCAVAQSVWIKSLVGALPVDSIRLSDPYWSASAS